MTYDEKTCCGNTRRRIDSKVRKSQFVSRCGVIYKLQVSLKLVAITADQIAPNDLESMPTPPRIM